jgi:DNA polymerase beta
MANIDHRNDILIALEKMYKKETADKNTWKARAYAVVIKQIKANNNPIYSIDDLKDIKGLGKGISEKIQEIIETGKLKQAEEYNSNDNYIAINDLLRVHAIGPAKAKELVETHGIKNIADLKLHTELLNDKQKMGLKYIDEFELRIPRKEMEKHDMFIHEMIKRINPELVVEIVGSYRRGLKDSGDIDVLITDPSDKTDIDELLKNLVKLMEKNKYLVDTFALGNKKYLGVCKVKYGRHFRRIDLLITKKHEFPFAIMYFTGDYQFNIDMRNLCITKGLSLSEYGLKYTKGESKGKFIENEFNTEEDIFNYLGLKFIPPNERKSNILNNFIK